MLKRLLTLGLFALTAAGCTFTQPPPADADFAKACSVPADQQALLDEVLGLVNDAREAEGLIPVVLDPTLCDVADAYACEMIAGDFFAHENPRTGTGAGRRLTAAGYIYYAMGENLAVGHDSAEDVVAAWLASPEHRANILDPAWREVGVAVRNGGDYGWYWVQEFADPVDYAVSDVEVADAEQAEQSAEAAAAAGQPDAGSSNVQPATCDTNHKPAQAAPAAIAAINAAPASP